MHPHRRGNLEGLWRNVEPKILGYFYRRGCSEEDSRELTQETALRACQNFHTLKGGFDNWVHGIARFVFSEYVRKQQKRTLLENEDLVIDKTPNPESRAVHSAILNQCLDQLEPLGRKCLILHDLEGWKYKKIGETLGISQSNAHYHVEKSRKYLRELFPELVKDHGGR